MSKQFPSYEVLGNTAQTEKLTFLQKFALWFRDFLENAE
jgi:hypothetical protein